MLRRLVVVPALILAAACGSDGSGPTPPPAVTPPQITQQPQDVTVNEGSAATFSVAATSTGAITYQWRRNGAAVPGATQATYTIAAAAATDDGAEFTVTATTSAGSVLSGPARLTVRTLPRITTQPQAVTVDQGAAASFTVVATGTAPLTYVWKRNGTEIPGATSATYTLPAAAASDEGAMFAVTVTNAAGSVESSAVRLTVRTPAAITQQPQPVSVLSGVPATFSVTATGTDVAYQWRRNGVAIPGATAQTYTVGVPLAGDNGASYSVVVSNALGAVTSAAAPLSVNTGAGLRPTSYANSKAFDRDPVDVPGSHWWTTRVFGDFFGNGNRDYFAASLVYDWDRPQSEAQPGEFQFHRWTGSGYVHEPAKITGAAGCIHPRKAAVADFNGDQKPDIFVACHGYDRPPFPGEPNYVILSRPGGVYEARPVGAPAFYHSVTAFDVDNDGDSDVVVTNNFGARAVYAFTNDGQGNFTERTDLLPIGGGGYFTVEAADVNGDGRTDLLVGGHDWEGAGTAVLINNGSGTFAGVTPQVLPAVPNEGVILDFAVLDADRNGVNEIYVLRTSGGDGTFYQSRTVQRVLWPSLASTVLVSERPAQWIPWINPVFRAGAYTLVPDANGIPFSLRLQ